MKNSILFTTCSNYNTCNIFLKAFSEQWRDDWLLYWSHYLSTFKCTGLKRRKSILIKHMQNRVTNPLLLSFPPPEDATGFFLFFPLTYCFSFSARSRYWTHFCRILSLDFSPWASSTVIKRWSQFKLISSLKKEHHVPQVSRTPYFVFSTKILDLNTVLYDLQMLFCLMFTHFWWKLFQSLIAGKWLSFVFLFFLLSCFSWISHFTYNLLILVVIKD